VFKYSAFAVESVNGLFGTSLPVPAIISPLGISFFTFQALSYVIDSYRKDIEPTRNFGHFLLYISFFAQLVQGPIIRWSAIEKQLCERRLSLEGSAEGLRHFIIGLAMKLVIANTMGRVTAFVYGLEAGSLNAAYAWAGAICFLFQSYFDFAGYSRMAVGLGLMCGFTTPENFNYPYVAYSMTDFWRRWHISLSTWFRDYVYIPLGGNRRGFRRTVLNMLAVWMLTGLWHGASWNFVLWGLMYGIILIFEKVFLLKKLEKCPGWICRLYTMVIVLTAWVLFAFTDIGAGLSYLKLMFFGAARFTDGLAVYYLRNNILLFVLCIASSIPVAESLCSFLRKQKLDIVYPLLVLGALFLCTAFITDASYNPFLYFRF
jgi:alginate O-acetyltransferase complex protein AlgI